MSFDNIESIVDQNNHIKDGKPSLQIKYLKQMKSMNCYIQSTRWIVRHKLKINVHSTYLRQPLLKKCLI